MPRKHNVLHKETLVAQFGGCCERCGYSRSTRALQFHHIDPSEKYEWSESGSASRKEVEAHPDRFMLLCANCHFEEHERLDAKNAPKAQCLMCQEEFHPGGEARRAGGRGKLCSKACAAAYRITQSLNPDAIMARIQKRLRVEGECTIWKGKFNKEGRPTFSCRRADGRYIPLDPRRVIYEAHHGKLSPQQWITNSCGNKSCARLEHIQLKPR